MVDQDIPSLRNAYLRGYLSRRDFMIRALAAGVSISAIGSFLAACSSTATSAPTAAPTAASTAAATAAAGPVVGNKKKQVAWAIGQHELPVIASMVAEMKKYGESKGYEVLFDSGTKVDIQAMISSIQAWITAGVPAMSITPFEAAAFEPLAKQAIDAGLIWDIYGPGMDTYHAWVSFPPEVSGQLVADAVVKWINENNPTAEVLISTNPSVPTMAARYEIPKKAIEEQTKAKIVSYVPGDDQVEGLQVTEAALKAHPNLRVVVGEEDAFAIGAAQAFKNAGIDPKEVFIIGNSGDEEALQMIKNGGHFKATAALNIKELADTVIQTMIDQAETGQPPLRDKIIASPVVVVYQDSPELDGLLAFYKS